MMWSEKIWWIFASFTACLSIGILGLGLFMLLPQRIRNRIEKLHEEE